MHLKKTFRRIHVESLACCLGVFFHQGSMRTFSIATEDPPPIVLPVVGYKDTWFLSRDSVNQDLLPNNKITVLVIGLRRVLETWWYPLLVALLPFLLEIKSICIRKRIPNL